MKISGKKFLGTLKNHRVKMRLMKLLHKVLLKTPIATSSIVDKTGTDIVAFKRLVFLTVMSSLDFEECAHKLLKAGIPENYELDLCRMLVDCCSQERSYRRFYGLLCQRFCILKQNFRLHFQDTCFYEQYENCHMLETNRLRHVALLFAHLLYSDAIAWSVMSFLHLNVEETNPSKRIFIKTIFKELSEFLGDNKLNQRLQDPDMQEYYRFLLPKNNPEQTRFSINFFTSIGLGPITVDMRNHLKMLKEKKILVSFHPVPAAKLARVLLPAAVIAAVIAAAIVAVIMIIVVSHKNRVQLARGLPRKLGILDPIAIRRKI